MIGARQQHGSGRCGTDAAPAGFPFFAWATRADADMREEAMAAAAAVGGAPVEDGGGPDMERPGGGGGGGGGAPVVSARPFSMAFLRASSSLEVYLSRTTGLPN